MFHWHFTFLFYLYPYPNNLIIMTRMTSPSSISARMSSIMTMCWFPSFNTCMHSRFKKTGHDRMHLSRTRVEDPRVMM